MSAAAVAQKRSKGRLLDLRFERIKNIETLFSHLIVFTMNRKATSTSTECQASESFRVNGSTEVESRVETALIANASQSCA